MTFAFECGILYLCRKMFGIYYHGRIRALVQSCTDALKDRKMLHYYYGDGKGKTSAAVGACIRASGAGMKCAFVQFHKNGASSEISVLKRLGADVFACTGKISFFRNMSADEIKKMTEDHNENLRRAMCGNYDLVVFDELGDALSLNTADEKLVADALGSDSREIIVTGHRFDPFFAEKADYITEFRCAAHPYKKGVKARKGIEF